jgi:hypothetical protein
MTFPNLPVATMRVARITQRDKVLRAAASSSGKFLLSVVDLSPLVMAIWSQQAI